MTVEGRNARAGKAVQVLARTTTARSLTRAYPRASEVETREYYLRYVLRDEAVGEWSDIVSATTKP